MTTQERAEAIAANEVRCADLKNQASGLDKKCEELKEAISRAVAAGHKTDATRKELRDANDEFDGLSGAIDILKSDREKLEVEVKAATLSESNAARGVALKEWGAASDQAQEMLRSFYENELAPVYAAVMDAAARVNQAESAAKAAGARIFTSELEYPEKYAESGGRSVPLLRALQANAQRHGYFADWGGGRTKDTRAYAPGEHDQEPEWFSKIKSSGANDSDGTRLLVANVTR